MPAKRALIVDDSSTAQYRLKKMLRPYGLHIDVMDSGEAALRYLATNEPDVIFMDHLMPGMDGFRALQIIKSHPETAMIPVIMYTSKSGDLYTGQARALGALDVVSKDTINSADLSKVLETIHIYPQEIAPEPVTTQKDGVVPSPVTIAEPQLPQVDRRAPSPASVEQARNLELRLSHLEHTLEDSRRFITARVVRELKGLHHSIKQELLDVVSARPAEPEVVVARSPEPKGSGWSFLAVMLLLVTIGMILFYAGKFSDMVAQSQRQQGELARQLVGLRQSSLAVQTMPARAEPPAEVAPAKIQAPVNSDYLADLAWVFSQTATIPFNQNNIDPRVAIRLQELLSRIVADGFHGTATITAFAGNFCLAIDTTGQPQLPPPTATMANCLFANEIYGLEQLAKHYLSDLDAVLAGLSPSEKAAINLQTRVAPGNYPYPDRQIASPREWNLAALANNRLELRLEVMNSNK